VIEANSGIITACLPTLRQPFVRIFGRAAEATRRQSTVSGVSLTRRISRLGFASGQGSKSQNNTVVASQQARESEEQMMAKEGSIYVLRDIRVTSSEGQMSGDHAQTASENFEMT